MTSGTYHIGLWTFSREFFRAAAKLRGYERKLNSRPVYYLYAHSIELALKSFLVAKGLKEKQLRQIGHNLREAWDAAESLGLSELFEDIDEIIGTIDMINPYYEAKELEYIVVGVKSFPEIVHMHNTAELLVGAVERIVRSTRAAT